MHVAHSYDNVKLIKTDLSIGEGVRPGAYYGA